MLRSIFDTESCGFYGPTVLIQAQFEKSAGVFGDVFLHDVFYQPIDVTLQLIDDLINSFLIGFNLTHDIFHLARTYNVGLVFKHLYGNKTPTPATWFHAERVLKEDMSVCKALTPLKALDLMLHGREGIFQSTMNQKPIVIRKFPKPLAPVLVRTLEAGIDFPPIMFSKRDGKPNWRIQELHKDTTFIVTPEERKKSRDEPDKYPLEVDEHFVHVRLDFHPAAGLKNIAEHMLGMDVLHYELSEGVEKPVEKSYNFLDMDEYKRCLPSHLNMWLYDERQRMYAKKDVDYTRECMNLFVNDYQLDLEAFDQVNHDLACHVGNVHFSGLAVNVPASIKAEERRQRYISHFNSKYQNVKGEPLNLNAPKQVLAKLHSLMSPVEAVVTTSADKDTLKALAKQTSRPYSRLARHIMKARRFGIEIKLLQKLIEARRFHATMKVVGTKSNRMAGGSMNSGDGTKINPQGIAKGTLRKVFTFADAAERLCGGDFDGFEVAIMEAVFNDPTLRADLLSGKKIHGLFGMFLYNLTYEQITSKAFADQYNKAKTALFADLYGAFIDKLAKVTGLTPEEVEKAKDHFSRKYAKIGEGRAKIKEDFTALYQAYQGAQVQWREPKDYVESLLGFRRYFTVEWRVVKALYAMACNLPPEIRNSRVRVKRYDKHITQGSAALKAVYASAFSLQNAIQRAAGNHIIQSVGGQVTKRLQHRLISLQPRGIHDWVIKALNIHDEIESAVVKDKQEETSRLVEEFLEEYKEMVPLISMKWVIDSNNWHACH